MNRNEMKEWLQFQEELPLEKVIRNHIPNEIFEDLDNAGLKSWKHKGFAYAYYYLSSYIYRNALYGIAPLDYCQENMIKSLISHPTSVTYITKKNGTLDKIGYTRTTTNYPISVITHPILEFAFINDIKKDQNYTCPTNNRFSIKEPIKALNRFEEDFTGTYYSQQNTHLVTIQRFIDIVTNASLGYVGLYVYAYLSMMNDRFREGYQISNKDLSEVIGCNERTLTRYTKLLEEQGYIKSERKLLGYKLLEKKYSTIDTNDTRKNKSRIK
jgi:hypothetical protein